MTDQQLLTEMHKRELQYYITSQQFRFIVILVYHSFKYKAV